jgi:hypothetical protein
MFVLPFYTLVSTLQYLGNRVVLLPWEMIGAYEIESRLGYVNGRRY